MITNTYQLINSVKKMYPVVQFFKDRYFPDGKNFYSEEVIIEMKKGNKKVAPFVVPVVNGIAVKSQKYSGYKYTPALIAPKSVITAADLKAKAFGEDPNSGRSAADRQNELQAERMDDLRQQIMRRHELMGAEILTSGKVTMKQYAKSEDFGTDKFVLQELTFYEDKFENDFVLKTAWATMRAKDRVKVLYDMASKLRSRGVRAMDVVLGANVAVDLFGDEEFLEYFNKKSVNFGTIDAQELPEGVVYNGKINIMGVMLDFFTYDEEYEDLDGTNKEFISKDAIIMLAPGLGETVYGSVDFVTKEGSVESYAEKIVPRVIPDENNNIITVIESSRPVSYPKDAEGWLICDTTVVAQD